MSLSLATIATATKDVIYWSGKATGVARLVRRRSNTIQKLCPDRLAAVCYRFEGRDVRYLLVKSSSGLRWTFPKGMFSIRESLKSQISSIILGEGGVKSASMKVPFLDRYIHFVEDDKEWQIVSVSIVAVTEVSTPKDGELGIEREPTFFSFQDAIVALKQGRKRELCSEICRILQQAHDKILLTNRK